MRDLVPAPQPITWVDIARRLSSLSRSDAPGEGLPVPAGVLETDVFWSGLTVTLKSEGERSAAVEWLRRLFPSRVELVNGTQDLQLKLEAPAGLDRLPLIFEVAEEPLDTPQIFRPSAVLDSRKAFDVSVPRRPDDAVPVFACHSVKGGVGRTSTAVVLAVHLARELLKRPVLLVDADFEAPGLSYLVGTRWPETSISFEDLLVLAHSDAGDDLRATVDFVASRLRGHKVDDLYVLPALRAIESLSALAIRPEHLVAARVGRPFLLVDVLRDLASSLGCSAIVVDLRAGLVEVAMQFLTDPSVERIFVTTTSGQSLEATGGMLTTLGRVQRATRTVGRKPLMVINQVPAFLLSDRRFVDEITSEIETAAVDAFQTTANEASADKPIVGEAAAGEVEYGGDSPLSFAILPHTVDLVRTSRSWETFLTQIESSGFSQALVHQLRGWPAIDALSRADRSAVSTAPTVSAPSAVDRKDACRRLSRTAQSMIVAETAVDRLSTPLVTPPLRRLAEDFQTQPPIAVIEGAKGTGKTMTCRFLMEQDTWRGAVQKLDSRLSPNIEGPIVPVYSSSNGEQMISLIGHRTRAMAREYGAERPMEFTELRRRIQDQMRQVLTEGQWSDFWLDAIAWVSGIGVGRKGAWQLFLEQAKSRENKPVAVFEGLEEVLPNPYTDDGQAIALRALIVDVPLRMKQEATRPVGLLVFVRGDMVEAVIRQNVAQFRAAYRNYALTWSSIDILELVVWLVSTSEAIPGLWNREWRDEERFTDLERIWGWKLGSERSREARSTEWVLAVLTDLNGRLIARDLVRFIATAAQFSVNEEPVDSRLLAPTAMRRAVAATSEQKVSEYPSEVIVLKPIFEKLLRTSGVETPLDLDAAHAAGLNAADLTNLVTYGVFFEEDGQYEVPELFRVGLGLGRKGARPNIISLTRRALEKALTAS